MQQHNSAWASLLVRLAASMLSLFGAAGYAPGLHASGLPALAGVVGASALAGDPCSGISFPYTLTGADNLGRVANLRQAIECANANGPGADTILLNGQTVALPASAPYADYSGQTGLPQITSTVNIRNGTLFHDLSMGGFLFRTFSIAAGGILNLQNMVLSGASAPTPGGAFHNSGTVNITNSTLHGYDTNNRAGVLHNASGATATIINSLLYDNNAVFAHAIDNAGAVTIVNSTFDKHTSVGQFGAVLEGTGYVVRNSIFWNPGSGPSQIAAGNTVSDSIVKGGYSGGSNILNISPLFVNEGGNDFRLQATSPAINVGVNANVPLDSTDVDGDSDTTEVRPDRDLNARIVAAVVDLGAYEDQSALPPDPCAAISFPYTVPDNTPATLVQAIECANADGTADIINLNGQTFTLTDSFGNYGGATGLPQITTPVTVRNGTITRSGSNEFRFFNVSNTGSLTLRDLNLSNGGGPAYVNNGGSILSQGTASTLTVVNTTLSGSRNENLYNGSSIFSSANFTIANSSVIGGGGGRGAIASGNGPVLIQNTLIAGNVGPNTTNGAGGVYLASVASATIVNSTIVGNYSATTSATQSGGIFANTGTVNLTVRNSIVWGNRNVGNTAPQIVNVTAGTNTVTHSLIEGGQFGALDADPLFLTPLAASATPSTAGNFQLGSLSPAVDAGANADVPADSLDVNGNSNTGEDAPDRAGNTRRYNDASVNDTGTGTAPVVDIGAYERQIDSTPPTPSVSIAVAPASVSEDSASNLTYTVSRSLSLSTATTVNISTSGTATPGGDFTGAVATVVIPAGATTATIVINPTPDSTVEPDETVSLTVAAGGGYTVGTPASATGTLLNDDLPTASVVSLNRASGNPRNTPTVTWTVTFSAPIDGLTPANFVLVSNGLGGTPTISSVTEANGPPATQWNISASTGAGSGTLGINLINDSGLTHDLTNLPFAGQVFDIDRTPPTVTITVADASLSAGETSPVSFVFSEVVDQLPLANISVTNGTLSTPVTADNITWTAVLTPNPGINDATNVITLDMSGSVDLANNPGLGSTASNNYAINTVLPTLSVGDISRDEGFNGVSGFDVVVSLSTPAPVGGVSFDIATADGTATAGSDYVARNFTAQSIAEGETTYVLAVSVNGDAVVETDETFFINISNVVGATIGDGQGVGSIVNDDTAGISVSPTAGLVTTEAGGTASFTVVLNSQPTANVAIGLSSSDATEGTVAPVSLTFSAVNWNVPQTVTVAGVDDLIVDGNVAYSIVTAPATSADSAYSGVNASDVSLSNSDNDSAGITVTPTTGLVTTEAGGTASFTVVLNSQPTANVAIGLSSSDTTEGTVAPVSLTFSTVNWNVPQTVTVTGVDDAVFDGDVSYSIVTAQATSTDPSYSGIDPADVALSNTDNDAPPVLSITSPSQPEGNAGSTTLNFVVSLSAISGQDVSFTRVTADGTATVVNNDYVPLTAAQATIPAGQLSITLPVSINGDTVFEGDETFSLNLTGISNATPACLSAVGTIVEDDQQPTSTTITSDLPDPSVVGQPYTVNVSVSGQTLSPLGTVVISDGSASCGPITLTAGTAPASSASCSLISTTAGTKTLTASYTPASSAFGASSDSETHQVNAAATAISVSGPASTPFNQPTSFSFALSVLAPGGGTPSGTVTLSAGSASCQVTVPTATPACDLSFSSLGPATVSASYTPDDTDHLAATSSGAGNALTTVFAQIDLQLSKTDADAVARPGETVLYTLSYRNLGSENATGVTLSETVPANTRFNQAASSAGWSCTDNAPAGTACSLAVGTLAAGASAMTSTFALRVDSPLPAGVGVLSNSASISDDGSNGQDARPEDNLAVEQTPVDSRPDLSVSKSTNAVGFVPGQTVVYRLDYRNQGSGAATGVAMIETVPEGTVFVAASSTPGWSCADGAVGGTVCVFSVGVVPAGQQGNLAFAVTLRAGQLGGVIRNSVRIEDDGSNGPDPTPDNNASVVARPALGVAPRMVPASGLLGHLLLVLGLMMAAGAAWSRQHPRG